MVTIGDDTLPGLITTIESAESTGVNLGAPGLPVLLGQADLSAGNADANTAYRVTRPKQARDLFGEKTNSMLTRATIGALVEGAYPVYAIAPETVEITGEDLSGVSGQSTTLANAPVHEGEPGDIQFTINSTTKTTVLYYDGDPENASPGTDEVYLNPQTGKAYADEAMGNTGDSVDYTYADYTNTYDEITNATVAGEIHLRDIVDFIGVVDENQTQVGNAQAKADTMEDNGWFAIAVGAAGEPYIDDVNTTTDELSSFSHSYDSSRLQLLHPTRDDGGNTVLGEYVGKRASIGIDSSPMFKRLSSVKNLSINLSKSQRESLVNARVVPLSESRTNAKIVEDYTTVSDTNTEEAAWKRGFARLVTDYTVELLQELSEEYIGSFNKPSVQNNIKGRAVNQMKGLMDSNAITGFTLVIEEVDSVTLLVDVGINTTDVLRNIELTVSAGEVSGGVVEG